MEKECDIADRCTLAFQNLGWEVQREMTIREQSFRPDLALFRDGKLYGFVEIVAGVRGKNPKDMKDRIFRIINEIKPKVFIITNGYSYDAFFYGEFATTLSVPPAADEIDFLLRMFVYRSKLKEMFEHE